MYYKRRRIQTSTLVSGAVLCTLLLLLASCTEVWDNHFDAEGRRQTATKTLWEEISARPELADFADVLRQTGYDCVLDGDQMLTVFAPKGTIDRQDLTADAMATEIVENHVARFAYTANATLATRPQNILMLNGKRCELTMTAPESMASGEAYTLSGQSLTTANIAARNGVLHVIAAQVPFFCNVWEYMDKDTTYSLVRDYLYSFNKLVLDEESSVAGAVVDGEITYVDSVVVNTNEMFRRIGQLNSEDSTYWMVLPTNRAWREAYRRVGSYYSYSSKNEKRDSLQHLYTQMALVNDLVFSRAMQRAPEDSLLSTTGGIFYRPLETLLTGYASYADGQACSNGRVFPVDVLRYQPWDSWQRAIQVEAENTRGREYGLSELYKRNLSATSEYYTQVADASFVEMVPSSTSANPTVTFSVPDVLSAAYDIKVVFVPQTLGIDKSAWGLPNKLVATLTTVDASGKAVTEKSDVIFNDPTRVDTVTLFTGYRFEACNFEEETVTTKLKIQSQVLSKERSEYSRSMLIDCIIFEPSRE